MKGALTDHAKMDDKAYRDALVEVEIRRGVPVQIREMREARGLSQEQFGKLIGKPQNNISRMENTRDTYLSIKTLVKIAAEFDVGLLVKFVPYSEVLRWTDNHSLETVVPKSYADEVADEASADDALVGDSPTSAHDFLVSMFAGRQLPIDGPDWKVFSSTKYANDTTPVTGGLDGTTRSSQGSLSLQHSARTAEPQRKSA
jgi:transcriptional regulator with XRE-family HTH domain